MFVMTDTISGENMSSPFKHEQSGKTLVFIRNKY